MQASAFQNFRIIGFAVGIIIHLLITNLTGQQIIDNSIKVYYAA